jgi:hypothetical protein
MKTNRHEPSAKHVIGSPLHHTVIVRLEWWDISHMIWTKSDEKTRNEHYDIALLV